MTFIYDAERAQQHKKEIDQAAAAENAKRKKGNIKRVVLTISISLLATMAVVSIVALLGHLISPGSEVTRTLMGFFATTGLVCLFIFTLLSFTEYWDYYIEPEEKYTPDVQYYLATRNGKILKRELKASESGFVDVYVTLETQSHFVKCFRACFLEQKTSTAVEEETADLEKGYYLYPYQSKPGSRKHKPTTRRRSNAKL